MELHKFYRLELPDLVQPFFEFVCQLYRDFPKNAQKFFGFTNSKTTQSSTTTTTNTNSTTSSSPSPNTNLFSPHDADSQTTNQSQDSNNNNVNNNNNSTSTSSAMDEGSKQKDLIQSTQSFKILAECPFIVVLLFQTYPQLSSPFL